MLWELKNECTAGVDTVTGWIMQKKILTSRIVLRLKCVWWRGKYRTF